MSERIDVEYFKKQKEALEKDLEEKVDTWLKDGVLPRFRQHGGVEVPGWIDTNTLCVMLKDRGFIVENHSSYQGSFVYLSYDK